MLNNALYSYEVFLFFVIFKKNDKNKNLTI